MMHTIGEIDVQMSRTLEHRVIALSATRKHQVLTNRVILLIDHLEEASDAWYKEMSEFRAKVMLQQQAQDIEELRIQISSDVTSLNYLSERLIKKRTDLQKAIQKKVQIRRIIKKVSQRSTFLYFRPYVRHPGTN